MHRFNMRTGELRVLKPQSPEGREPTLFPLEFTANYEPATNRA